MIDFKLVPAWVKAEIDAWANSAAEPGDFVKAVLQNDLKEAFAYADDESCEVMHSIVGYCYNEIPGPCWGSPEKMKAWREQTTQIHQIRSAT